MAVFEAANKDVATIAQHCLCPRKEFLKRLANSADVRYMFRYCMDDALGAAMVFPPSVSPERCRVTLPSRARSKVVLSRADAFWPVVEAALGDAFRGAEVHVSDYFGFKRAVRGVKISDAPLRAGDFVAVRRSSGLLLVQLAALCYVAGDAPAHERSFYVAYAFHPVSSCQRLFAWAHATPEGGRLAGPIIEVLGRALTFDVPGDPSVRYFSASSSAYTFVSTD